MKPPSATDEERSQLDSQLAEVLAEVARKLQSGGGVDLSEYVRRHPGCAERLEQLLPAMQTLAELGHCRSSVPSSAAGLAEPFAVAQGVLGDFRIVREIGRGGMGIVYEAEQITLRRRVALKLFPFAAMLESRQLQRFRNEAQAAAALDHPNIVHIHWVGCERGIHFYAMQYIEGRTLAEVIKELRQCPEPVAETRREPQAAVSTQGSHRSSEFFRSAARLGIQAAEALEHAHQVGVVHRDVKPSNLMVESRLPSPDGRGAGGEGLHLWITDFGLAMTQKDPAMTATGDLVGTLRYMSPEQALGNRREMDHRSDIYSLGVTLYELLTLAPAFVGEGNNNLIRRIAEEEPRSPSQVNPAVPKDLETIVLKAMAKEPTQRYATAQQMADDLRRFLEHKPIQARRPSLADRATKWARRHRTLVIAGFVVLVAATMALSASTYLVARARNDAQAAAEREREARADAVLQRDAVARREAALRRYLFAADVRGAWEAWTKGEANRARQLLDRQQPAADVEDLREFAWHYLWRLCTSSAEVLQGHTDEVYCVAVSPDGRTLVSGGKDRTVVLWDMATRQKRATLLGHADDVNFAAFAPDGKLLVTSGEEREVKIWDVEKAQLLQTLKGFDYPVAQIFVAQGGKTLVIAEVQWSPGTAKTSLWDAAGRQRKKTIDGRRALAIAPDGRTLAMTGPRGRVHVLDLVSGNERTASGSHPAEVLAGAFSPDGQILATGARERHVRLWKVADLAELEPLRGSDAAVRSLAFSPGGDLLASACDDRNVWLWDYRVGNVRGLLSGHRDRAYSTAFAPDGKALITASQDRTVRFWRLRPNARRTPLSSSHHSQALHPDGDTLATVSADCFCQFLSLSTGQLRDSPRLSGDALTAVAISPDARLVAVGTNKAFVFLYDLAGGRPRLTIPPKPGWAGSHILSLEFSPNGRLLAGRTGSAGLNRPERFVTVWDSRTGQVILELKSPKSALNTLGLPAFSPDSRLAALIFGGDLQLANIETGEVRNVEISSRGYGYLNCLAYSPDGRLLAVGSSSQTIGLVDPESGRERATLLGHRDPVHSVAFSPDGKTLASGSEGGEVKLWDVFTAQELLSLGGLHGSIDWIAFTGKGDRLLAVTVDSQKKCELMVWQASDNTQKD